MLSKLSGDDCDALLNSMTRIGNLLFASACSGMETPLLALYILYSILFPDPNPVCSFTSLYACEKEKSKIPWESFVHGKCKHGSDPHRSCVFKDMAGRSQHNIAHHHSACHSTAYQDKHGKQQPGGCVSIHYQIGIEYNNISLKHQEGNRQQAILGTTVWDALGKSRAGSQNWDARSRATSKRCNCCKNDLND